MNVIPTVGVLTYQGDNVLLVRHGEKAGHITGTYGLPAGRIEKGELEIDAAIREFHEETGLTVAKKNLFQLPFEIPLIAIKRADGTINQYPFTVFLCRKFTGVLKQNEETVPEWIPIVEVKHRKFLGNVDMIVEKGQEYR